MKITAHEGLTRYMVQSDTEPDQFYLVDLVPYWGVGWCQCPNFRIRLEPKLTTRPLNSDDYRCKHIIACRNFVKDQLLDMLIATEIAKEKPGRIGPDSSGSTRPKALPFRLKTEKHV